MHKRSWGACKCLLTLQRTHSERLQITSPRFKVPEIKQKTGFGEFREISAAGGTQLKAKE